MLWKAIKNGLINDSIAQAIINGTKLYITKVDAGFTTELNYDKL